MILGHDGFDGYDSVADAVAHKWYTITGGGINSTVRAGSGKSFLMGTYNANAKFLFPSVQDGKIVIFGFALYLTSQPATQDNPTFLIQNSVSGTQCYFGISSTNKIYCAYGNSLASKVYGTTTLSLNAWYYVELKFKVDNTTGLMECYLNSTHEEFSVSGVDTQANSTNSVSFLCFDVTPDQVYYLIDDFYVLNTDSPAPNNYLGEQRAQLIYPSSDYSVQFSRNTGSYNWDAINDVLGAPDDLTSYVYDYVTGHKDLYGLQDLSGLGSVNSISVSTRAATSDAGPKTLKHGIQSDSVDQQVSHALTTGMTYFIDYFTTSDGASTAFTPTTINSLLSSIEVG